MEILVCVRRVPDTSENEIELNSAGNDIERDELVYSINEADNYAVEEALQIVARVGGSVTVATVGNEDDEEVLRREMAMGANHGVLISDEAFSGSDGRGIATILKAFVQKGSYDLILTGVQAEDGGAQVGGMLAALLDYPFASLVNSIEVLDGKKLKVSREIAGGNKEMNEIDLPCVLSIQTGINEPRYVGMRGIRQVASVPIPTFGAADLGIGANAVGKAAAKVKRVDYFIPALGKGAEILHGTPGREHRQSPGVSGSQRRVEIMARIFAYIVHKKVVADDSAFELAAAARKIDPVLRLRPFSPVGVRTSMPRAMRSALPTLRFGKSPTKLWLIPMLNWCEKPC
jgi:electron transfer flavoprotein beta subunit